MKAAISLVGGSVLDVLAVDASKAPAFSERFERGKAADDAREMVKAVDECIEFGVPLFVQVTDGLNLPAVWMTVRNHAVQVVTAA